MTLGSQGWSRPWGWPEPSVLPVLLLLILRQLWLLVLLKSSLHSLHAPAAAHNRPVEFNRHKLQFHCIFGHLLEQEVIHHIGMLKSSRCRVGWRAITLLLRELSWDLAQSCKFLLRESNRRGEGLVIDYVTALSRWVGEWIHASGIGPRRHGLSKGPLTDGHVAVITNVARMRHGYERTLVHICTSMTKFLWQSKIMSRNIA